MVIFYQKGAIMENLRTQAIEKLEKHNQMHLLQFENQLTDNEKAEL